MRQRVAQKFRKRALDIEAVQWTGDNIDEVRRFTNNEADIDEATGELAIATLEGVMFTEPGGWVIRGIHGEFYACEASVFADSYDPVSDKPIDPLSVRCGACLARPGEPCYSTSSDLPRNEAHRLRFMAAAQGLEPCPTCNKAGWVPVKEEGQS